MAYGKHLPLVNSEKTRARRAAWFRAYYAKNLKRRRGPRKPYVRNPSVVAKKQAEKEERQHEANIRRYICRKCGNHRLFVPDSDGRCAACARRKRLAYKKRAQESGKWGVRVRLAKHRRRALRKANGGDCVVTASDWQWVLDRYGSACLCCGSTEPPTMDHVVPLSLGGPHDKTNLQPLCHLCNSLKQATVADYRPDRPLAPMARDPRVIRYVE